MQTTKVVVYVFIAASTVWAAADEPTTVRRVFLDNSDQVMDGSTSYEPETRTCGHGHDLVFTTLDGAAQALVDADVLFLRSGTYTRESVGSYHPVHGNRVNYSAGALSLEASGTPKKRKVVSAYQSEKVVLQARPRMSRYNPDPGDERFAKSSHYYPHPAVSISGAHLLVRGIKTYGQVVISGHHITLEHCDLGGGGPHMNQGQVIALNSNREGGVHDVVLRDNKIHHSCWGESRRNGAALMCYNTSFVAEHNEFYDLQSKPWSRLASDHNLCFSTTAETTWHHLYRKRATTLDGWRAYSDKDQHSVWNGPDFVKASGRRPEHFKRKGPLAR